MNDDELLRFCDLKARKIVSNYPTLKRWIEKEGFPPGFLMGPNSRVWWWSTILTWLASRPTENQKARACRRGGQK